MRFSSKVGVGTTENEPRKEYDRGAYPKFNVGDRSVWENKRGTSSKKPKSGSVTCTDASPGFASVLLALGEPCDRAERHEAVCHVSTRATWKRVIPKEISKVDSAISG